MTHCPRCHQPLDRSTALIPGVTVLACRKACRRFAVQPPEGIDWEWLEGGPGLVGRLIDSHERAKRTVAIRQSEDDDIRWTSVA